MLVSRKKGLSLSGSSETNHCSAVFFERFLKQAEEEKNSTISFLLLLCFALLVSRIQRKAEKSREEGLLVSRTARCFLLFLFFEEFREKKRRRAAALLLFCSSVQEGCSVLLFSSASFL